MKKMITLGFIACASLTSSTTFGMLVRQLHNNTKKIAGPQKKYTNHCTEIFLTQRITQLEQQNTLLKQEIAATEAINQKLKARIKNTIETPKETQHKLKEMEDHQFESKYSKYQQDMNRYHSSKQSE